MNYWTQKRPDGQWETKKEGAERASRVFDTQAESWEYTKELAREHKVEAILKGMDNQIRERNSYASE